VLKESIQNEVTDGGEIVNTSVLSDLLYAAIQEYGGVTNSFVLIILMIPPERSLNPMKVLITLTSKEENCWKDMTQLVLEESPALC